MLFYSVKPHWRERSGVMEDGDIVGLYWRRDEQAIAETAEKYGAYCLKLSMNILADRQESEENVNDTYFKTWTAIPTARPRRLGAFVGKIARNLALNRWQADRAAKRGGGELALSLEELDFCIPSACCIEAHMNARSLGMCISAYLYTQREEVRRVFVRRYFSCDSVADIAAGLGISESKVKSILFRARNGLRHYLEREEGYSFGPR